MKTVLAYSGGLDTSVLIKKMQDPEGDYATDIVTFTLELGQGDEDLKAIEAKAKALGARATHSVDAREEFVREYISKAIKANGLYEGKYPLGTAIGRPLIAKKMVELAQKEGADAVAHGSTGKGNDQVRFDVSFRALNPKLKIIAPMRDTWIAREDAIDYAEANGIDLRGITKKKIYSVDENLWCRSCEGGPLEDPYNEPGEDAYRWTKNPADCPESPSYIEIDFEKGVPVALDGKKIGGVELIATVNKVAGENGVGRIDMIEDRLVGIKSREVYECPAAITIIEAHKDLESLVFTREERLFKEIIDSKWSQMAYMGQWFEPLMEDLNAFIDKSQEKITGTVRVKLFKGTCTVVGRKSKYSLYDAGLATYDASDTFDHKSAEGFIKLWGLPSEVAGLRARKQK